MSIHVVNPDSNNVDLARFAYAPKNIIATITRFPSDMSDSLKETLRQIVEQLPMSIDGLTSGFHVSPDCNGQLCLRHNDQRTITFQVVERLGQPVEKALLGWMMKHIHGKTSEDISKSNQGLDILYIEPDDQGTTVVRAWLQKDVYVNLLESINHVRDLKSSQDTVVRDIKLGGNIEYISADSEQFSFAQSELNKLWSAGSWKSTDAPSPTPERYTPFTALKLKLKLDTNYAWSWHCNLAMAFVDAGGDPTTGNFGAAKFMKDAFGIDTSKFKEFEVDLSAPNFKSLQAAHEHTYRERNLAIAALARLCPTAGRRKTTIEGWDEAWRNCVYIDLPEGQISYHYHDSQAELFASLPTYQKEFDGHTKEDVHERLTAYIRRLSVMPYGSP